MYYVYYTENSVKVTNKQDKMLLPIRKSPVKKDAINSAKIFAKEVNAEKVIICE